MPDVTLRLEQPAALGRRPRGSAPVDTYQHVPGSVLRGALAAAWIRDYGPPQDAPPARRAEFLHLFEGPVRYGPLFDATSDVVPISVLTCKYLPEDACRAFHHDQAASSADGTLPRCAACGGRTQPGRGEVGFFGADPGIGQDTRVALDPDERAADGKLFTRRSLRHRVGGAARELTGRITGGDPARTGWLLSERQLRIGGRRSTAGAATYLPHDTPGTAPDPAALVRDRTLIVRLTSPALLVDAAGRPTARPDERQLSDLLGVRAFVERTWTRREQLGGWHALTNLPKPAELAVSAGSVFRLRLDTPPSSEGLARLVGRGLGLRRAEGFGWVELGPWTPPRTAVVLQAQEKEDMASGVAHKLHEHISDAGWYLDKLRGCLLDRRLGRTPDLGFLDSRRAEPLDRYRNGILRVALRHLVTGDLQLLEKTVVHLEARVRKERTR